MSLVLAVLTAAAIAGAPETGSIGGVVRDDAGAPLQDCTVFLASEEGARSRKQQTGASGGYFFADLAVGRYRLQYGLNGFEPAIAEGVRVDAGGSVVVEVTMRKAESGSVTRFDRIPSGLSETLDEKLLERVPTGRSLWTVLELVPSVVSDRFDVGGSESGQQSLFSAAGTAYAQNQYFVEGANVTDTVALGASSTYYSYDSFEEILISTAGQGAEIQAPGVRVDIVLKAGGNQLGGGAGFYFENGSLQSDNLDERLRAQGVAESNRLGSYRDWSLSLGGPVVRDRAFFYASYGRQRLAPYAIGFFLPGGEPGLDPTDLGTSIARGTLELGHRQGLGFLFLRNEKLRPYRDAGRFRPAPETTLHQDSATNLFQARYSRALRNDSLLDARFSFVKLDFPLGEQPDLPAGSFSRIELTSGVRSGGPGTNELFERDRYQGAASLSLFSDDWLTGSHHLKIGVEAGTYPSRASSDLTGAILYRDFFGAPLQVELYSEPISTESDTSNLGLYARDSYVRGRLVLDLGARFDRWIAGYPDQARNSGRWEEIFAGAELPRSTASNPSAFSFSSMAPRLGFTYGLTSKGRTLLRGSYGRYYHQIGSDLATLANPNRRAAALFHFSDRNRNRVLDPGEIDPSAPLSVSIPSATEIDPAIAQPRTDEVTLGLYHQLGNRLALSATLLYRKDRLLIDDVSVGVPSSEFEEGLAIDPGRDLAFGTEDDGLVTVFNQSRESLGRGRLRLTNPEGLESRYRGLVLEGEKLGGRFQVLASFTVSEAEGYLPGPGFEGSEGVSASTPLYDDPNSLTNARGRTFWDRPRILRLSGTYEWKWGVRFASAFRHQTGQPLYRSILVSETADGTPLNQGPIEILAESQGAAVQPGVSILDLRAEKAFPIGSRGGELELTFDLFNAFNANTATTISSRRGAFGAIFEILPPRVARIGIRYRFGT